MHENEGAADQLLDRLDQLIAVPWFLADQPQQQRAQVAGAEEPSAATTEFIATATPAAAFGYAGPMMRLYVTKIISYGNCRTGSQITLTSPNHPSSMIAPVHDPVTVV
jgi:hypothetical protein